MPRGDKTGPSGKGMGTGWGRGGCVPPKKDNEPIGYGRGLGRGLGRGQGRGLGRFMPWNWAKNTSDDSQTKD
jgi:hypothetical protein